MIPVELSRIVITELNSQQVIFLREKEGTREFPIIIGIFEATMIDRKVKGFQPQRPLTHDLVISAVEILGAKFQDVTINRVEDQTFYASIRVTRGEELIEIDSRPSDAIAVAVSCDPPLPIFVDEQVFEISVMQ